MAARALAVGDLVAPLGRANEMYCVVSKYPQPDYVRVLPYQRSGTEVVLFRTTYKRRRVWTDGSVQWLWLGHAA